MSTIHTHTQTHTHTCTRIMHAHTHVLYMHHARAHTHMHTHTHMYMHHARAYVHARARAHTHTHTQLIHKFHAFIFQISYMRTEHFCFISRISQVETWRPVILRVSVVFFSPSSPMPGTQIRPRPLPYRSLLICYALIANRLTLHSMC